MFTPANKVRIAVFFAIALSLIAFMFVFLSDQVALCGTAASEDGIDFTAAAIGDINVNVLPIALALGVVLMVLAIVEFIRLSFAGGSTGMTVHQTSLPAFRYDFDSLVETYVRIKKENGEWN